MGQAAESNKCCLSAICFQDVVYWGTVVLLICPILVRTRSRSHLYRFLGIDLLS